MVLARPLVELAQQTLTESMCMAGLTEGGPLLDGGTVGRISHRDEFDLPVAVDSAVHGCADDIGPVCERFDDHTATRCGRPASDEALGSGTEQEDAVLPAEVALVGESAQQVVGGGKGKPSFPRELLRRRPFPMGAHSLQQSQRPLNRTDQRRDSGTRCRGQRSPPGMVTGIQPSRGGRPHGPAASRGSGDRAVAQTTGQDGDGQSFPSRRQRSATVSAPSVTSEVSSWT